MKKLNERFFSFLPTIIATGIAIAIYLFTMPSTVQEGDTAELVLAGFRLGLAHPPGYPLQIIFNWFSQHIFFFLSPYQASSLGSLFLMALSVAMLARWIGGLTGCLAALLWASSYLTWKWAILPDVFSGLMVFTMAFAYLLKNRSIIKTPWHILLAISVLHHHLIIFMLPVLIYAWIPYRQDRILNFKILIFGTLSLSGYFLLLFFDDQSPGSWGQVNNLSDLIKHFLRTEYGTTQLSAHGREVLFGLNLSKFFYSWFLNFWSLIILAPVIFLQNKASLEKSQMILGGILIAYLTIIIGRSGLNSDVFGLSTLERFFLMPSLIILLILFSQEIPKKYEKFIQIIILINFIINLSINFPANNYRNDKSIARWVTNVFNQVPKNSILWISGDTESNASRYMQEVEKLRPDIVLMTNLDLDDKDFSKISTKYPDNFKTGNLWHEKINWSKVRFYSNDLNIPGSNHFHKNIKGLLAEYKPGNGEIIFDCLAPSDYIEFERAKIEQLTWPDIRTSMLLSYGKCHLNQASQNLAKKDFSRAKSAIENGLNLSPIDPVLQIQYCLILKGIGENPLPCEEKATQLLESAHIYYLPENLRAK